MSDKTTLTLPEEFDIGQVESIKEKMDKALAKEINLVEIKADKVIRTDSAAIQLLLSFKNVIVSSNRTIVLVKPSKAMLAAATLLGATELLEFE